MKCAEIMTPNPQMCTPEDNVAVAVNLMWDYDCGAVPVVKNLESKELVGMVTDRDIAMHVIRHAYVHPSEAKVGDCMVTNVIACQLEDSVEQAIQLMGENRIRRLPVVDPNGICVGIISQADLLSRAATDMEAVIALLQQISIPHSKIQKASAETPSVAETPAVPEKEKAEISAATEKEKPETPAATEKAELTAEKSGGATGETASLDKQGSGKKDSQQLFLEVIGGFWGNNSGFGDPLQKQGFRAKPCF